MRVVVCWIVLAAACEGAPGRHDAASDIGAPAMCHAQADCPGQACCLYICDLANCYPPRCADPAAGNCWYTVCDPDAGPCTTRLGSAGTCQAVSNPIGYHLCL